MATISLLPLVGRHSYARALPEAAMPLYMESGLGKVLLRLQYTTIVYNVRAQNHLQTT